MLHQRSAGRQRFGVIISCFNSVTLRCRRFIKKYTENYQPEKLDGVDWTYTHLPWQLQENGSDSGIFVMCAAERIARDQPPSDTQVMALHVSAPNLTPLRRPCRCTAHGLPICCGGGITSRTLAELCCAAASDDAIAPQSCLRFVTTEQRHRQAWAEQCTLQASCPWQLQQQHTCACR